MLTVSQFPNSSPILKRATERPTSQGVSGGNTPEVATDRVEFSLLNVASEVPARAALEPQQETKRSAAPAPVELSAENSVIAAAIGKTLAAKLEAPSDDVVVSGFDARKGFNASDLGFAVSGELQFSAWTEGLEVKFVHEGQSYTYRGLDANSGRYGQDSDHEGYWKQDQRGIYVPDPDAPSGDSW